MKIQLKHIFKIIIGSTLMHASMICFVSADSLWLSSSNNEIGMFSDKKAYRLHERVQVKIEEAIKVEVKQRTKSDKTANINNSVTSWLFPDDNPSGNTSGFGKHKKILPKSVIDGSNSYTGGGEIKNEQKFETEVSARVIDVMQNGELLIEGFKSATFSGETHFIHVRGYIRSEDIDSDNSISSKKIENAVIEMISEGTLSKAQREGWLMRINGIINPF